MSNPALPKNWSELAEILQVSRQLVAKHRRRPDAPKTRDVAQWEIYLAAVGQEGSAPSDIKRAIAEKRLAILTQTEIAERRKNAVAAAKVLDAAEVCTAIRSCVSVLFSELDKRFLNELPSSLKGKTEVQIRNDCAGVIEQLKDRLRSAFDKIAQGQ